MYTIRHGVVYRPKYAPFPSREKENDEPFAPRFSKESDVSSAENSSVPFHAQLDVPASE
jgi:hypothetical protein